METSWTWWINRRKRLRIFYLSNAPNPLTSSSDIPSIPSDRLTQTNASLPTEPPGPHTWEILPQPSTPLRYYVTPTQRQKPKDSGKTATHCNSGRHPTSDESSRPLPSQPPDRRVNPGET
ncbi:hypothetical protein GCG54_00013307 [Colletotrichum gloeosporioides]|uniref:Uncharacterized protein n=1 Tax=Colletotrichum gloeosporioides TaxID=474922 RepID=A0A8H4CG11_COLGL|nr:uncharacterized protein GCG54_00013307 [Colletotrichum gloeosporioides]KAF3803201.1 hypothetical protein GCG54_00013307 [Colletotrichum gloeosporioides]